jgi:hypothetical protein
MSRQTLRLIDLGITILSVAVTLLMAVASVAAKG